jgi:hypothetical protein
MTGFSVDPFVTFGAGRLLLLCIAYWLIVGVAMRLRPNHIPRLKWDLSLFCVFWVLPVAVGVVILAAVQIGQR